MTPYQENLDPSTKSEYSTILFGFREANTWKAKSCFLLPGQLMTHWRLTVNSSRDHLERSLHPRTWQERILRRISSVMKGLAQMFLLFDQDPGLRDCFKVSVRT